MPTFTPRLRASAHRLLSLLLLLMLITPVFAPMPVAAAPSVRIVYVKPDAPDFNSGASWAEARSLQGALLDPVAGDEIWVAAGVYYPGYIPQHIFTLKSGVALYGGFAGSETSREQRNPATQVTVLSGDLNNDDAKTPTGVVTDTAYISGTNAYRVVNGSNTDSTAVLDGFTITAGSATGPFSDPCGVACGGGLYMFNGNATLANLTFSGNRAFRSGGGIYLNNSSPILTKVIFDGNRITDINGSGGGMYNSQSSPILTDVIFSGNQAANGGGMYNPASSPRLTNVTFSGNQAANGGGIYNQFASSPILTNVIFSGNLADNGGGMQNEYGSSPILTNVTFSGNQAANGGGMYNLIDGSPNLTNVTFSGNQATQGSGMLNSSSSPVFQNSIVWDNTPNGIVNENSSVPTFYHSLVEGLPLTNNGNLDGTDSVNDPLFVRDVDCGPDGCGDDLAIPGDTSLNDDYGDLHLLSGSPAIDAGDNAADLDGNVATSKTIADIPTDLAGQPRIVAVKRLPATVDMGAYEASVTPPNAHAGGPYTVNEGSSLALNGAASTDDGDDGGIVSYSWDCTNDGMVDVSAATPTGSTCTYPDDGSHTLRLTVTDNINATGTATTLVTVANVAPTYTPAPNQSTFASSANLFTLGSFTDPGAEGSWPITVNWGDNSALTEFTVNADGSPPNKSHTYATAGTYNVFLTVSDGENSDDGGFQVVVNPLPPGAPAVTPPAEQTATTGTDQTFALGSFTDVGSSGPWQVTVNWGDGSTNTQFSATTSGELPTKPHTYAANGVYEALVTVSDGVLSASASFRIIVSADSSSGSITGLVLDDANGNGTQEEGEEGVAGTEITLESAAQVGMVDIALTRTTTTDADGRYRMDNVPPGAYTLTVTPPSGYQTQGASEATVTVETGETTTAPMFTLQLDEGRDVFLPSTHRP